MSDNYKFESVPTTARAAEFLALRHGYDSLNDLVQTLPDQAKVIDVGAGASPLGMEVARQRPDIHLILATKTAE